MSASISSTLTDKELIGAGLAKEYRRCPDNYVVELTGFTALFFQFDDPGVAELFEFEVARLVVDTSSTELVAL